MTRKKMKMAAAMVACLSVGIFAVVPIDPMTQNQCRQSWPSVKSRLCPHTRVRIRMPLDALAISWSLFKMDENGGEEERAKEKAHNQLNWLRFMSCVCVHWINLATQSTEKLKRDLEEGKNGSTAGKDKLALKVGNRPNGKKTGGLELDEEGILGI